LPNTIAHFAVNGILTRSLIKGADLKWIYLGCVIPDFPWIIQRIINQTPLSLDVYDLRAYCIAQASLLLCIILCAAFAMLAKEKTKVFLMLAMGSLLHLLLDAVQFKWANGVHLFVPFNWELLRFDLFWPESVWTYLLTASGAIYLLANFKTVVNSDENVFTNSVPQVIFGFLLIAAWLTLPFMFMQSVYKHDNHFINTLKNVELRTDKTIQIDRNTIQTINGKVYVNTAYGEQINLVNIDANLDTRISLKGKFIQPNTIYVDKFHKHTKFRDYASMLGLTCVLVIWVIYIQRRFFIKQ
jgi:hypothetical protein